MPALTVLVAPSITDTPADAALATYTVSVTGSTATEDGLLPTGIVAVMVLVAPSITDTLPGKPPPAFST